MNPLIQEYRNGILDNEYYGEVCILKNGELYLSTNNPYKLISMRSTEKYFHILPFLESGLDKKYNLDNDELAILVSSHVSGFKELNSINKLLSKVDVKLDQISCSAELPVDFFTLVTCIKKNKRIKSKQYNSCIGNHIINILAQKSNDEAKYWDKSNVYNTSVKKVIQRYGGRNNIKVGYDNCGMPCYFLPLYNFCLAFYNFINDKNNKGVKKIDEVIHGYPTYIDGSNSLTAILLSDKNIICKMGSHGIFIFLLKKENISIGIKLYSTTNENLAFIVYNILSFLEYNNDKLINNLKSMIDSDSKGFNNRSKMEKKFVYKFVETNK